MTASEMVPFSLYIVVSKLCLTRAHRALFKSSALYTEEGATLDAALVLSCFPYFHAIVYLNLQQGKNKPKQYAYCMLCYFVSRENWVVYFWCHLTHEGGYDIYTKNISIT